MKARSSAGTGRGLAPCGCRRGRGPSGHQRGLAVPGRRYTPPFTAQSGSRHAGRSPDRRGGQLTCIYCPVVAEVTGGAVVGAAVARGAGAAGVLGGAPPGRDLLAAALSILADQLSQLLLLLRLERGTGLLVAAIPQFLQLALQVCQLGLVLLLDRIDRRALIVAQVELPVEPRRGCEAGSRPARRWPVPPRPGPPPPGSGCPPARPLQPAAPTAAHSTQPSTGPT